MKYLIFYYTGLWSASFRWVNHGILNWNSYISMMFAVIYTTIQSLVLLIFFFFFLKEDSPKYSKNHNCELLLQYKFSILIYFKM